MASIIMVGDTRRHQETPWQARQFYKSPFGIQETFCKMSFYHPKWKNCSFTNITEKSDCSVCISLGKLWNISQVNSHQTERTAQSCSFHCFATSPSSLAQRQCGCAQKNLVCLAGRFLSNCKKKPCSLYNGGAILLQNISWVQNRL